MSFAILWKVSYREMCRWIKANLPADADVYDIGTLGFQYFGGKIKWLGVLSQRHFIVQKSEINSADYVLLDYTDALSLRDQNYVNFLQDFDSHFQNATPMYNKNNRERKRLLFLSNKMRVSSKVEYQQNCKCC